ncbi:glycosyltransferase [Asticcacaulis excentricus]|uniref:Glycosyl transferase group 1 n=1 Tax=Asticcacaulis excentricus (strain ATCC 15261 / DSM 4724 / KCTC 12464 / NCIMB 9791 / VKM B-1370 / CB 48) TaxID=573065 RepID=E8RMB7_ASTEC|nr:glycosyltransferase [Asticcacaulis excentricus]ADU13868.1 glycosyl transferase group 1 [Asticcacaulis excentricus CB 48]
MKVALVHYWLVGTRGGEKVLDALCEIYPQADVYTLVADHKKLSPIVRGHKITTSFLQKIGGVKHYKRMLPLMPMALESFDLSEYDLIISSEAGPAKGIIPGPNARHICYCHSPMRYIWDLYPQYYKSAGLISRAVMAIFSPWLRAWDVTTSARVDHFIANSEYVAQRIKRYYRRDAVVINPPVDLERFSISEHVDDYYLCAGQITPYKRVDLAVKTFTAMSKPLVVLGGGATDALKKIAGPTVKFVGQCDDETMAMYFQRCKALVYPGVEDFGIIPLEALASGRPVVAYAKGGALETVIDGVTGLLFQEQTVEAVTEAILRLEQQKYNFEPRALREFATSFDRPRFIVQLKREIERFLNASGVQLRDGATHL